MSTRNILMAAAAGNAAAPDTGTYVEDVFSTYLYTGNGTGQTINNGIALGSTAEWSVSEFYEDPAYASYANRIATNSSGDVYVTGQASPSGSNYGLLVKYNSSGTVQWQRKLYEGVTSSTNGICVDSSGNVLVGGAAKDATRDYGVVAKYNASGVIQWQRKLYDSSGITTANCVINGVVTDSSDNVYVAGYSRDATRQYALIAKYNASGTIQWQRKLYESFGDAQDIAIDSSGNVYVAGGGDTGSQNYLFVAKYNSSGTIQWQRKLYQGSSAYGFGIAVDSSSNVYVTGWARGGTSDYALIAKYNSSGTIQWQRKLYAGDTYGYGITVNSSGDVFVTGTDRPTGDEYALVAKYNSSGTLQWQRLSFSPEAYGWGLAADGSGNLYVSGAARNASYIREGLLVKLAQDGSTTSGIANGLELIPGTLTDAAGTATEAAGTATDAAGTATDAAGTATDAAGTATFTYGTQAAVTGKGGLVWIKERNSTDPHILVDTTQTSSVVDGTNYLSSNSVNALTSNVLYQETANGFILGNDGYVNGSSAEIYASWTFTQQPKFFDIVTYTGNGSNRTIAHSLGAVPGCIMVKCTNAAYNWYVYHRSTGNDKAMILNSTLAAQTTDAWNYTTPTSSVFSVGTGSEVNEAGKTYVAYIFGHDAGGFGENGVESVISCGSYTANGSSQTINLGWEPQWLLLKQSVVAGGSADITDAWIIVDCMRGLVVEGDDPILNPNSSAAENTNAFAMVAEPTATGWITGSQASYNGATYIYIAIRRGPMRTPTDATTVFLPVAAYGGIDLTYPTGGFNADMGIINNSIHTSVIDYNPYRNLVWDRLRGFGNFSGNGTSQVSLQTHQTSAEPVGDYWMNEWSNVQINFTGGWNNYRGVALLFRRAPGFFDVVCYTGTGSAQQIAHNLGVAPEIMIIKSRSATDNWLVGGSVLGDPTKYLYLDGSVATSTWIWYLEANSATFDPADRFVNNRTYVAYLFASCPGVSKVGTYTGNGSSQTLNCGFSAGARFVLIKRTDSTGDWYVWDTARGIVSANDPHVSLNTTTAEVTTNDSIDPVSSGFIVNQVSTTNINVSSATYIYLAIA